VEGKKRKRLIEREKKKEKRRRRIEEREEKKEIRRTRGKERSKNRDRRKYIYKMINTLIFNHIYNKSNLNY